MPQITNHQHASEDLTQNIHALHPYNSWFGKRSTHKNLFSLRTIINRGQTDMQQVLSILHKVKRIRLAQLFNVDVMVNTEASWHDKALYLRICSGWLFVNYSSLPVRSKMCIYFLFDRCDLSHWLWLSTDVLLSDQQVVQLSDSGCHWALTALGLKINLPCL